MADPRQQQQIWRDKPSGKVRSTSVMKPVTRRFPLPKRPRRCPLPSSSPKSTRVLDQSWSCGPLPLSSFPSPPVGDVLDESSSRCPSGSPAPFPLGATPPPPPPPASPPLPQFRVAPWPSPSSVAYLPRVPLDNFYPLRTNAALPFTKPHGTMCGPLPLGPQRTRHRKQKKNHARN